MTNKLPVVGKRYRWKHAPDRYHLVVGFFRDKIVAIDDKYLGGDDEECLDCAELMTPKGFWCNCEEIPEDKAETKPVERVCPLCHGAGLCPVMHHPDNPVSFGAIRFNCSKCLGSGMLAETKPETQSPELSPEVKDAMEELREEVSLWKTTAKEISTKMESVLDCWGDRLTDKSQSLLNALDKQFNQLSESVDVKEEEVKEKEESIWKPVSELPEKEWKDTSFIRWCDLSCFINDYEKLKERVKKLEKSQ